MGFQKDIPIGNVGVLTIKEENGVASVSITLSESVGGGQAYGAVKAKLCAEVDLDAHLLIDLGFKAAESKFPSVAPFLVAANAAIDAELAK